MANVRFKGEWLARDFEGEDDLDIILNSFVKGYGVEKWNDPAKAWPTYGLYKVGDEGRVALGTFAHPDELIAMLKLILASEE